MKHIAVLLLGAAMILSCVAGCSSGKGDGLEQEIPGLDWADDEAQMRQVPSMPEEVQEASAGNDWEFSTPESCGVDPLYFEALHQRLAGSQMYAVVTVKDGAIVNEYYQEDYDENSVFHLHSITKSVMGALIGIAVEQGVLDGVDVKLATFFPQMADGDDTRRQDVHRASVDAYVRHWAGGLRVIPGTGGI